MSKKIGVVELNKEEEEILLEKKKSKGLIFYEQNRKYILPIFLLLSLFLASIGGYLVVKTFKSSTDPTITKIELDLEELESTEIEITEKTTMTTEAAIKNFNKIGNFDKYGEVILTKEINKDNFTLKFYSDGTALKIMNNGTVTRINHMKDGSYGIDENGVTNSDAETRDVTISKEVKYSWGTATYYSDGSVDIKSSDIEIFVRNSADINDTYISNNKVTYVKEEQILNSNTKIYYYYDGTIEVVQNNETYVFRDKNDIKISGISITFTNNNKAFITKTVKYDDGLTIKYLSDGGAFIINGTKSMSVRKSNSIVIKDNKIYEIVDNKYVTVAYTRGDTTFYTNGGAVSLYNKKLVYAPESSNVKFKNNSDTVDRIEEKWEKIQSNKTFDKKNIKTFETVAVIETEENISIVPADDVIYNSDGTLKDDIEADLTEDDDDNTFKIINNTTDKVKYRIVIEKSDRTTLDVKYIRYQLVAKDKYIEPTTLNETVWQESGLASKLSAKGINYVLIESTIEPFETIDVSLMLWTDYETIPNSMQNKYFYGTIKVYSWKEDTEEEE